jgi:sec-independent protein translocase protein TatC
MQKPLLEHLIELRRRLIYIFLALGCGVAVSYPLAPALFHFLTEPLVQVMGGGRRLIYTGLTEAFLTYLKLSFFSGFVLSLPFILWQGWFFIAPGLYPREKKVFFLLALASPLLFISGAALAYYVICPMAWKFFLSFEIPPSSDGVSLQLEARMSEYLSLILKLILAFGICFQLPLILMGLHKIGLVTLTTLRTNRKYAFLIIVIIAAIMTPPDIISPLGLIIPLYALYEISILLIKFSLRKQDNHHA